jgi:sulfite oxidase
MSQYNDSKQKSIIAKEKASCMIVRSDFPYNSEPPKKQLSQNFITPNNLFYVRNHGEIPDIDPKTYKFTVTGLVNQPKEFTLKDIQSNKFTHITVVSPLQCAGNRRTEMIKVAPLQGEISWGEQAISNAEWKGVPLREILEACGVKSGAKHVEFIGLDHCEKDG